ncbi:MAG: hypothetical protein ABI743_08465, partial [bacterium]
GVTGYEIDYENNGSYDATAGGPNSNDTTDEFSGTGYVFPSSGPQTVKLRITDGGAVPESTVCDLTVTVSAPLVPTLDPLPAPGGINSNMANATLSVQTDTKIDIIDVDSSNDAYYMLRTSSFAPTGWYVYKSVDGGATWPTPANVIPQFANGALTYSSNAFGLATLANGLPAAAVVDGSVQLGYIAAQSETPTSINWGAVTDGVEISTAGAFGGVSVLPSPTVANRVYVLAQNQSAVGSNPNGIVLWLSTNGASNLPTFTQVAQVDTDGATTLEVQPTGFVDSTGDLHIAWISSTAAATDEVMYRKFDDDGSATGGTWVSAPVILTDGAFTDADINGIALQVNTANEPAVAFSNATTVLIGDIYLTKNNAGVWSTPRKVNDARVNPNNFCTFVNVAFDSAGRVHMDWRDDGDADGVFDIYGGIMSSDGRLKTGPDFRIFDGVDTTTFFTASRLEFMPGNGAGGKMLATCLANAVVADGKARYRLYDF